MISGISYKYGHAYWYQDWSHVENKTWILLTKAVFIQIHRALRTRTLQVYVVFETKKIN